MILDTSAIIALLGREIEASRVESAMCEAPALGIAAPTLVELGVVLWNRLGRTPVHLIEELRRDYDIEVIPFTTLHWQCATDAFGRFGKGRHAARITLGDCFRYAAARVARRPLLYVGGDFGLTDVLSA